MISMQSGLRCMRESAPSEPLDGYPAIDYNLMLKPPITTLWKFANNPLAPHPSVYGWIPSKGSEDAIARLHLNPDCILVVAYS
jgi:hypothetical protein